MDGPKRRAVEAIGDRDLIPADEAWTLLTGQIGRQSLVTEGVSVVDGMVLAKDLLAACDRRTARRAKQRQRRPDASLTLKRIGAMDWEVRAPWGVLGSIHAFAAYPSALATPPQWICGWAAEVDDVDLRLGAINAQAAQVIVVRHTAPQILLPAWADQVRELDAEHLFEAQRLGSQLERALDPADDSLTPAGLTSKVLSGWEIEHLDPQLNPAWVQWAREGSFEGEASAKTPAGLQLQTRHSTLAAQWDIAAVAVHCGVKRTTVDSWRARGRLPEPDGLASSGAPWWRPETIISWHAARPGRGNWR